MPTIIDALVVTLGLDTSDFKKGQEETKDSLKETRDNAEQAAKDMEAAGKRAASFFGAIRTELLALLGLTLSAQGIKSFITSTANSLQQLGINSKALDMSAKSLDGWSRAAEAAGSSAEKMQGTLASFQDVLTQIRTGGASDSPLFAALASFGGATGANFDYKNDNSEAIMRKIAQNWNKLNEDAKRRFGGMFGFDNATQQALSSGALVSDADKFTKASMATEDATRKAADFNRQLVAMKQNFSAAAQVLFSALIPYVEQLIPLIAKFGNWIATHGPEIEKFFADSAAEISKVVDAVGGWQNALEILLAFVVGKWALGMLGAIGRVMKSFGPLLAAIAAVSAWDKIGNINDEAKSKGMTPGDLLIQKMKEKDEAQQADTDTIKDKISNWWHEKTDGYEASSYNAYGTKGPRGIRNNNPGNLNYAGQAGATKEGGPNGRFAVFGSMTEGVAALYKQLQLYFQRGTNTIESIVKKYAPASDGNNVMAYINQLVKATGKGAGEMLNSADMPTIFNLMKGIINHENGKGYVSDNDIMGGIQVGARAAMQRNSGSYGGAGSKTEINIGKMEMTTSASNQQALATDMQRNIGRSSLLTPSLSGQG
ncbi:Uncharacterised protein [Serratia fonticola]|uniref:hypothetical protein n=1 Tax=Serratia fonticola TaxID=47917 RepID=UPI00217BBC13|nr:hypothetical protein [Serratia fonticola]CAI1771897.1 Uncharacterised protein [Serratia fonticola]